MPPYTEKRAIPTEKTYFYVFLPDTITELAEKTRGAFERFEKLYGDETKVLYFRAGAKEFRRGLTEFGIKRVPAFAIADTEYNLAKDSNLNPYISFDRPFLEGKTQEEIFDVIQDMHNVIITEDLLHLRRSILIDGARRFFGKVWDEVKDIIQVGLPR